LLCEENVLLRNGRSCAEALAVFGDEKPRIDGDDVKNGRVGRDCIQILRLHVDGEAKGASKPRGLTRRKRDVFSETEQERTAAELNWRRIDGT
jgi:hypothetical protein